jgi:hypothetical protein
MQMERTANRASQLQLVAESLLLRSFDRRPQLTLNNMPMSVVGVMPESFDVGSIFIPGTHFDLFAFPVSPKPIAGEYAGSRGTNEAAIDQRTLVRCFVRRSGDDPGNRSGVSRRRSRGWLSSCPPSIEDRSHDCPPRRLAPIRTGSESPSARSAAS